MSESDRLGCSALRLASSPSTYSSAKSAYEASLSLSPTNVQTLCNYALFCHKSLRCMDDAEALFRRGLAVARDVEEDPGRHNAVVVRAAAKCVSNYGNFLKAVRGYATEAERMHEMAVRIDPGCGGCLGGYAKFVMDARHDFIKAEEMFKRAIELEPNHGGNLATYARMLKKMGRFDGSEEMYRRALGAEPRNVVALCNYANFLKKVRGDVEGARTMYLRGLRENPNAEFLQRNYALFLRDTMGEKIKKEREEKERGMWGGEAPAAAAAAVAADDDDDGTTTTPGMVGDDALNTLKEAEDPRMEMSTNEGRVFDAQEKRVADAKKGEEEVDESTSDESESESSSDVDSDEKRDKPNPSLLTGRRSRAQAPAEVLEGGWVKYYDSEAGCEYYWNERTGVSTYDRPLGFSTVQDAFSSVRECTARPLAHEKPKEWMGGGWKKYFDPGEQYDYYYHGESGESTWERPPGFETEADPFASVRSPANVSVHDKPKEKIKGGWSKYLDESTQFYYYYNHGTGESTFDRPVGFETEADPFKEVRAKIPTDEKVQEVIGGGTWKKYLEEATDYFYYYNETTGESTYDRPADFTTEMDPFADIRERNLARSNNFEKGEEASSFNPMDSWHNGEKGLIDTL